MIGDSASTLGLKQRNRKVKNKSRALISGIQQSYFYSKKLWQSDIGIEDLTFATYLVESMISKWYFYSKNLVVRNSNQILHQRNLQEIQELDTIDLFNELAIETETAIIKNTFFRFKARFSKMVNTTMVANTDYPANWGFRSSI